MKKHYFFYLVALLVTLNFSSCNKDNDPSAPKDVSRLFVADWSNGRVGYLDLSNPSVFVTLLDNEDLEGDISPIALVVDRVNGHVYVSINSLGNKIIRMDINGGNYTEIYTEEDGIDDVTGLAVDPAKNALYWNNNGTGKIMKGNLSGTATPVAVFGETQVLEYSYGLALDTKNGKIYWTDFSGNDAFTGIWQGNLNGTGTPVKIFEGEYVYPSDLVYHNGRIYWTDESTDEVKYGNANGTGSPTVLYNGEDGVDRADGIDIDPKNGFIYWSETNTDVIAKGSMDGGSERAVLIENIESYSIKLY
jgi:hypothetical protein